MVVLDIPEGGHRLEPFPHVALVQLQRLRQAGAVTRTVRREPGKQPQAFADIGQAAGKSATAIPAAAFEKLSDADLAPGGSRL